MSKKDSNGVKEGKAPIKVLEIVREAVKKAGSLEDLSDDLKVQFSTVWRWYAGKTRPSQMAVRLIQNYLKSKK